MPGSVQRLIPVLGIIDRKLVKTLKFGDPRYIGDPLNAIKVFNEKEVDELAILDIRASVNGKGPDLEHLKQMAGEAFMPLGYGGGIRNFEDARKVFECGVEKVILNSILMKNPKLISEIAEYFGTQSVVVSLDYRKGLFGRSRPAFYSGRKSLKNTVIETAIQLEKLGAGEIILHNVDRDGTFSGFDLDMLQHVSPVLQIPVVPLGGAGDRSDVYSALKAGAHAVAASGIFVFKNNDRNSILINYRNLEKE